MKRSMNYLTQPVARVLRLKKMQNMESEIKRSICTELHLPSVEFFLG